ncbi:hypothetical protein N7453_003145 [Penicillium expansum]|nr:hypothetical protein N7453_003145 [Penicillium expansum]
MEYHKTDLILSTLHTATSSSLSSTSFFTSGPLSTHSPLSSASSVSPTSSVSSGSSDSSESGALSFSSESMAVNTSEGGTRPLQRTTPVREETAEEDILDGITVLAIMLDRKEGLDENLNEERDRIALRIEDAKVLLGLHLCRIEDELTRKVLLETFLLHLGPTDAPWMLTPLLARLATGV